jgi:SAM-dependent methyltransferase
MKRYFFRDVARSLRSHDRFRYMIAVMRQLGGVQPRECPLCGYRGLFEAMGHPPRYDAICRGCDSRERHRLIGLLLAAQPDLGRGARLIHFAPETLFEGELRRRAREYRTADLFRPGCDLKLDIESMDLPNGSVDLFVVNHVLEHVDYRKALAELFRCLSPGGRALLTMPIVEGWPTTYENPAVAFGDDDRMRILHFGWPDHLRFFGADIRARMAEAGFAIDEFKATGEETVRYGLVRGETVFIAGKPVAGPSERA